ncbi:MAG: phosphoenolpyruvate mutase [Candidatus Hydrogenedentota bacterium]
MTTKTRLFRQMIESPSTEFVCHAYDALSARIVEEAGFKGIWAGGLGISSAMGVRDNNELSWTQTLEIVEFMCDATQVPIMLDADTGYGDFNTARRLVAKLEHRGVAAMCIEDNLFPKTNSLLELQMPLASSAEFAGKIRAVKDTQKDPDFCVIARVQAFIAGLGLEEALRRAHAYRDAGADAIFIHSNKPGPEEILSFLTEWKNALPVIIVPTMFYRTPTSVWEEAGVSMIIWANHILRANILTMKSIAAELFEKKSLLSIEEKVATLKEVFRLSNMPELREAEKRYLPEIS